jgi:hypothetical protein
MNHFFFNSPNKRHIWSTEGSNLQFYTFNVFTIPALPDFTAFLSPFDFQTWFVLGVIVVMFYLTSFFIYRAVGWDKDKARRQFQSTITFLLCSLLGQEGPIFYKKGQYLVLLGSWLIFCFFIIQIYEEGLFDSLTFTVTPSAPDELTELLQLHKSSTNFPIITTTYNYKRYPDIIESNLLRHAIPDMLEILGVNSKLSRNLMELQKSAKFFYSVNQSDLDFVNNISNGVSI